jgi:hypothetical protein
LNEEKSQKNIIRSGYKN